MTATEAEMTLTYQIKALRDEQHSLAQRMWLLEQDYAKLPAHIVSQRKRFERLRKLLTDKGLIEPIRA